MQEITAVDAAKQLHESPDNTVLLDVREAVELQIATTKTALHIPMGEIPARFSEIDSHKTIICICHHGGRSAQVVNFLEAQGYAQAINLTGGIEAWSQTVDPSIPRY